MTIHQRLKILRAPHEINNFPTKQQPPVMLPLQLLNTACGQPMMVELKNGTATKRGLTTLLGETYNGILVNCDNWMNINLKQAICTSASGDKFAKMDAAYIRGSVVKYLRIPEQVIEMVKERPQQQSQQYSRDNNGRGGGRGGIRGAARGSRGGNRGGKSRASDKS